MVLTRSRQTTRRAPEGAECQLGPRPTASKCGQCFSVTPAAVPSSPELGAGEDDDRVWSEHHITPPSAFSLLLCVARGRAGGPESQVDRQAAPLDLGSRQT